MAGSVERVLKDLHEVIVEIEGLVKETTAAAGDGASGATQGLQAILTRTRARLADLEKTVKHDVQRSARAADRYVHDNAWKSLATAAAAALLMGVLLGRRR